MKHKRKHIPPSGRKKQDYTLNAEGINTKKMTVATQLGVLSFLFKKKTC